MTTSIRPSRDARSIALAAPVVSPVSEAPVALPVAVPNADVAKPSPSPLLGVYKRPAVRFVRAEGVELFDESGRGYLDFTSGIAVNSLGYGDPGIANAVQQALSTGLVHTSNLYHTDPAERLAHALVERSFADRVFFCNSGAEANEGAFKLARRWARQQGEGAKHEIIALRGGFHGRLFATLAATDRPGYRAPFRPLAGGISICDRDMRELAAALDPDTVAAVIVEPVQGEGGVRVLDSGFLAELRALTKERNILLIFDEIQCGLGRTGTFFAYERAGVVPDILTLAKPIAGGLPMGAILMTESVASAMQPGDHGTTFGGGPLVSTVALHVVERLSSPAMLSHVRETGAWLGASLQSMADRVTTVRGVRGAGFMWGVDTTHRAGDVIARALESGLLVCSAGDHTIRLLPPLVMTREQLGRGLGILESALAG